MAFEGGSCAAAGRVSGWAAGFPVACEAFGAAKAAGATPTTRASANARTRATNQDRGVDRGVTVGVPGRMMTSFQCTLLRWPQHAAPAGSEAVGPETPRLSDRRQLRGRVAGYGFPVALSQSWTRRLWTRLPFSSKSSLARVAARIASSGRPAARSTTPRSKYASAWEFTCSD